MEGNAIIRFSFAESKDAVTGLQSWNWLEGGHHAKAFLILVCLLLIGFVGCMRTTYNIAPVFHGEGSLAIDVRVDADDPRDRHRR